jgi:hypothetical protein
MRAVGYTKQTNESLGSAPRKRRGRTNKKAIIIRMAIILAIATPSVALTQSGGMFKTRPTKSPDVVKL